MKKRLLASAIASSVITVAANAQESVPAVEEMLVISQQETTFGNSAVTEEMVLQTSPVASVLDTVDSLPGVLVNEGAAFGGDDWSTTISMRGFQVSLDEQQLGMTVDGIPNGNSNYGGGSKANRFIDTLNLQGVQVSQGTSDIASRSHEALGGSLNFMTSDPLENERLRTSLSLGDHGAQKLYGRYDTGEFLSDSYAWISLSTASSDAWMDASGESNRDHVAAKLISTVGVTQLTGYLSYDDTHEDNYQRVSIEQFEQNPDWDRLTGEWTGIPHIDQLYRRGWSTNRENTLGYLKADVDLGAFRFNTSVYYHENEGTGDWLPPYIANVTDDNNRGHSELISGRTVYGGDTDGLITFVNAEGESVAPIAGCESSLTFPYGGAGAEYDPACHEAGAIPVSSYRHTHYEKERYGFNADVDWTLDFAAGRNVLRGGVWYEDYLRTEWRDWHKLIDSRTGYHFDHTPYWIQYSREYPTETLMFYVEDSINVGPVTLRLGAKQFDVEVERKDNLDTNAPVLTVNTDSDVLASGGLVLDLPVEGFELFYGYAENFAAIKDPVIETAGTDLSGVEPETAENQDLGLRYEGDRISANLTYYDVNFDNRITYVPEGSSDGIDYLNELDGSYTNVGGIESKGVEAAAQLNLMETLSFYVSYTHNESEYLGTNEPATDRELGIFVGNTVAGSAQDMFVLSADWHKAHYLGGISMKHVGERYLDDANTTELETYNLVDAYLGVDLGQVAPNLQGVSLRFNVNNLTDERYLGGVAGGAAWIAPGRTATASLTLDF